MNTTPSTFRLSDETRASLRRVAEVYRTNMTDAMRLATESFAAVAELMRNDIDPTNYPFEAYQEALLAYREFRGYKPGHVIDSTEATAVSMAVAAAWPTICEAKIAEARRDTLRDVVVRLEGFGVDPDVVGHFVGLMDERD